MPSPLPLPVEVTPAGAVDHASWLLDRLDVLRAIDEIETDFLLFERRYGQRVELEDLRPRLRAVRVQVYGQMWSALADPGLRIH